MSVILPPNYHVCDLPDPFQYPLRSFTQCPECGRWSFIRIGDWGKSWYPLFWWHWRLRRSLRAALGEDTP